MSEFRDTTVFANNGAMISTVEKLRAGVTPGGMSPEEDMRSVGEARGNVVRHAYDEPLLYEVSLDMGSHSLTVKVLDYGRGFDAAAERDSGSLGLSIISRTSDNLNIESIQGERTLVIAEIRVEYRSPEMAISYRALDRL